MKKVQGTIKRSVEKRINDSMLYGVGYGCGANSFGAGLLSFVAFFLFSLAMDSLIDAIRKKYA